jgi:uncharacterized protein (UPF0332 family)
MREVPISPVDYVGLLTKMRELFILCSLLISHGQYAQAISRLYYGYFHIARLIAVNKNWFSNYHDHKKIWDEMPQQVQSFGIKLKNMRVKYDYDPNPKGEKEDLSYIYSSKYMLDAELKELEATIQSYPHLNCDDDDKISEQIQEIREAHENLIKNICLAIKKRPL